MSLNILMLSCVIAAPPEPAANESVADPILLAHRGVVRHAPREHATLLLLRLLRWVCPLSWMSTRQATNPW